jgi:hypothetical protein
MTLAHDTRVNFYRYQVSEVASSEYSVMIQTESSIDIGFTWRVAILVSVEELGSVCRHMDVWHEG